MTAATLSTGGDAEASVRAAPALRTDTDLGTLIAEDRLNAALPDYQGGVAVGIAHETTALADEPGLGRPVILVSGAATAALL